MPKALAAVLESPRNFQLREFAIPEIGEDDAVLRVEACGLCGTDYEQWLGHLKDWGGGMPIIPGHEVMGFIERIGPQAAKLWNVKEGDRVAIEPVIPCGHCEDCVQGAYTRCRSDKGYGLYQNIHVAPSLWGGYATHLYLHPRTMVHKLPSQVPTDVMTLFNPLSNAIRWVYEAGGVGLGSSVVIAGPGQRGLLAVAAAKRAGAATIIVTGTTRDGARLQLAERLGATATIDVQAEDPVERVMALTGGKLVDVVLDVSAGAVAPVVQAIDMVKRGGRIVLAGLKGQNKLNDFPVDKVVFREIELVGVLSAGWRPTELAIQMIGESGAELRALCSHSFPLEQATDAVRSLGRESSDGREAVHVTLCVNGIG
ncbi:Threonine dehydrogenase or related Zn-dependent dehydrogenase [Chelatococcus sambhunathii]|uniref:Threonine dehydrogenase or related Zn-dependent dehydrogenase n=1 Tax=Chelatococcus sambhunathii TaxID=363953 RepID=A0ABM9UH14_9HYPH|nr:alcohol dehydrogenase catalytic domain-containing protein [Chelatococcus sambhunathii]CUA90692.1 Threonine dehydrogenase or related Zn-dependent dehydrogenase [Chelatococcus sambhunathii]